MIPPQKAGRIAEIAGAADNTGWCPIDPVSFASKLVPNIHVIGDACIAGQLPKSASAAQAQGKACAAAIVNMMSGKSPEIAAADRRLLQHGRARLRLLAVRRLSAQRRAVRRGRGRDKPGQCAARGAPARGGACRKLVQDDHGGYIWLDRQTRSRRRGSWRRFWHCPPRPARKRLRPYAVVGDAIPEPLTNTRGDVARGRALVVERHQHLHPLPQRPISGTEVPGRSRPQPRRFRQPLVGGPASASAGRCLQPQCRDHHAVLLSPRRSRRGSGRPGAASRSCRPNRSRISWRILQACVNRN